MERHGFTIESCVYYCSKDALRAIEIGHYFGLPSLISKILFVKWVLVQSKENLMIVDKLFRKYYDENLPEVVILAKGTIIPRHCTREKFKRNDILYSLYIDMGICF